MLITKLELDNVKSYGQSSAPVVFKPGVNLIWGDNGSGKSTLLESIGYALFGALDYNQSQLRREGEKSGEIVVTFISDVDERTYQVVRKVGSGSPYIYDVERKRHLTRTKVDFDAWLSDHIGLELGKYATVLFENAVGVAQGRMTGTFLEGETARKGVFDSLLRVEEYETAWTNLRTTHKALEQQLHTTQKDVANLEGQLQRMPQVEQTIQNLIAEIADKQKTLAEVQQELHQIGQELEEWNQAKTQLDTLARQKQATEIALQVLKEQITTAQKALQEAVEAEQILFENETGYTAYSQALKRREILETQRLDRDQRAKALQDTEKELTTVSTTLGRLVTDLDKVVTAETELVRLTPLVKQQENLELQQDQLKERVAECQRAIAAVEKAKEQIANLIGELDGVRIKLLERVALEKKLDGLNNERKILIEKLQQWDQDLSPLYTQRKDIEATLQTAKDNRRDWEHARSQQAEEQKKFDGLTQRLAEVETKLNKRSEVQQNLETINEGISAQQTQQATAKAEEAQYKSVLQTLEDRLNLLQNKAEAACPVCKRPLDEHQTDQLEIEFGAERKMLQAKLEATQTTIRDAGEEIKRLQKQQKKLQDELNNLPTQNQAESLKQEIDNQEAQLKRWTDRVEILANASQQVLTIQKELDTLNEKIVALEHQRDEMYQAREQLDEKQRELNDQLLKMPQPTRMEEIETQISEAQNEQTKYQALVDERVDASKQLTTVEITLAELGDPRQMYYGQQAIANQRPQLEQEQAEVQVRQTELLILQEVQRTALNEFATLDTDLNENNGILKHCENSYQLYTANEKVAQSRQTRQEVVNGLLIEQATKQTTLDTVAAQYIQAEEQYDGIRHQDVQQQVDKQGQEVVRLGTQIEDRQQRLKETQEELEGLYQQRQVLKTTQAEVDRLNQLTEAFKFVREGIRRAGPQVVQKRVKTISHQANSIFQEILDDHTMTLNWDQSYAITTRYRGETRAFKQLSGGEQMAAAIAVRLALLMQMSEVRTLFLDEPTANLDDKRRLKLAERLTQIQGLRQIFVITHDNAFRPEAHHLIAVRKENGCSIIER